MGVDLGLVLRVSPREGCREPSVERVRIFYRNGLGQSAHAHREAFHEGRLPRDDGPSRPPMAEETDLVLPFHEDFVGSTRRVQPQPEVEKPNPHRLSTKPEGEFSARVSLVDTRRCSHPGCSKDVLTTRVHQSENGRTHLLPNYRNRHNGTQDD